MAESEEALAEGLAGMVRGDESDESEAAAELLAETVLWWRAIMRPRLRLPAPQGAAEAEYRRRTGG